MKITLVGMGMGNPDTLTRAAWSALEQAQRMIGARRLLEALPPHFGGLRLEAVAPQAILRLIEEAPQEKICVVFSGDTGFYSGAKKVTALLQEKGYEVKIHCGVSTVQYLARAGPFLAGCPPGQRPWRGLRCGRAGFMRGRNFFSHRRGHNATDHYPPPVRRRIGRRAGDGGRGAVLSG